MFNKTYIKNLIKLTSRPLIKLTGRGKKFLPEKGFWEIIYKNYPPQQPFNFIQVGANDGVSFDILYDLVIERDSRGIVIEPLKDFYHKLCHNYREFNKIIKTNKAVHPSARQVSLYRVDANRQHELQNWTTGIASLDPEHHKKSNTPDEFIVEEKVAAAPLMEIVKEAGVGYDVDLLQIDVEGFDFEVIKMINFKILRPAIIKYEHINLSDTDKSTSVQLLKKNGYYLFEIGDDMVALRLDKIKL